MWYIFVPIAVLFILIGLAVHVGKWYFLIAGLHGLTGLSPAGCWRAVAPTVNGKHKCVWIFHGDDDRLLCGYHVHIRLFPKDKYDCLGHHNFTYTCHCLFYLVCKGAWVASNCYLINNNWILFHTSIFFWYVVSRYLLL